MGETKATPRSAVQPLGCFQAWELDQCRNPMPAEDHEWLIEIVDELDVPSKNIQEGMRLWESSRSGRSFFFPFVQEGSFILLQVFPKLKFIFILALSTPAENEEDYIRLQGKIADFCRKVAARYGAKRVATFEKPWGTTRTLNPDLIFLPSDE